ncbi:DUF4097 domain-containing protein [uncultured Hymenobacter sp.]|uniref:DUF4097 family beta strand repeat-containing protein n=1 Tax=uncultured Hymenobacter sp. TaxID=170016 RepID=UPI0035CC24CC
MFSFKAILPVLMLAGSSLSAAAQTPAEPTFTSTCEDGRRVQNSGGDQRYCETRDLTLPAPAGQPLTVRGGANGGIAVRNWAGADVRVRVRVQGWAGTQAEAQARVKSVAIGTSGHTLQAQAPGPDEQFSVSYEIFVPEHMALVLRTMNGGISVEGTQGDVRFNAVNGGVSLSRLGGKVAGHTVNGGLSIALSGQRWEGAGLDVETTNGGISWQLPSDYSARLFTSTNVGSISTSLPIAIAKSGLLHHEISTTLGQGGAQLRAVTTNGGISIR